MIRGLRHAREQLLHPQPDLVEQPAQPPVQVQAPRDVCRDLCVADIGEMAHCGAQVAPLQVEPGRRRALTGPGELGGDAPGEGIDVARVRIAHRALLAPLHEPLDRVLAHRGEHREHRLTAHIGLRHERPVDQRLERAHRALLPHSPHADRIHGVQSESGGEDPEIPQQEPLVLLEESRRPLDRRGEGALAPRDVPAGVDEESQLRVEALQHRRGGQEPHPGGRELDGERQAVQRLADGHDGRSVPWCECEVRLHGPGAFDEQLDGGRRGRARDGAGRRGIRRRQRRHLVDPFATDAQHDPARHEEHRVGGERVQPHDLGGGIDDLLEVVEDDEHAPPVQRERESLIERSLTRIADAESRTRSSAAAGPARARSRAR